MTNEEPRKKSRKLNKSDTIEEVPTILHRRRFITSCIQLIYEQVHNILLNRRITNSAEIAKHIASTNINELSQYLDYFYNKDITYTQVLECANVLVEDYDENGNM